MILVKTIRSTSIQSSMEMFHIFCSISQYVSISTFPLSWVFVAIRLRQSEFLNLHTRVLTLKMEACSSETSVTACETIWCHNPKDSNMNNHISWYFHSSFTHSFIHPFINDTTAFSCVIIFFYTVGGTPWTRISPSQGRYLYTGHKYSINAHRHPCLKWEISWDIATSNFKPNKEIHTKHWRGNQMKRDH
jgi:hypothetical protein